MAVGGTEHLSGPGVRELIALCQVGGVGALIYFGGKAAIRTMLKTRSEDISKKIVDARLELEGLTHEASKARTEIASIEKIQRKMIEEVEAEGKKLYDSLVHEAKITAQRILEESKATALNEVETARRALKAEVVERAVERAMEMVTGAKAEPDAQRKIHEGLLDRFSGATQIEIGGKNNGLS